MVSWNPIPKKLEALIKKKYKKAINNQYAVFLLNKNNYKLLMSNECTVWDKIGTFIHEVSIAIISIG